VQSRDEPRIDSRVLAYNLRGKHKSLLELVRNYKTDFEALGKVPFQTEALPSGQSEKFVPLTEDQAYLLLTYTRNTARTRSLKLQLVKAFSAARRNAHLRQAEYLPEYHALHDQVAELARGSANQQRIHANFSRLVNKVAGIEAGQRSRAPMAILATVCSVAARAMADATDHRDGYQRAKAALMALAGLLPMAQSIRSLDTTKVAA
jgi:phage regulator Rha-like protein